MRKGEGSNNISSFLVRSQHLSEKGRERALEKRGYKCLAAGLVGCPQGGLKRVFCSC